jgi:hypothetical protein
LHQKNPGTLLIEREQALSFRLDSHHLARRLPSASLLLAAGVCGVQNTPPGSAALSLHARVDGLAPRDIQQALWSDKSLLQAWSMRGAPYVFPANDRFIFTRGLLPLDEESIRAFIPGVVPALERIGIRATEVVGWAAAALVEVLAGCELTKDQLGGNWRPRFRVLSTQQRLPGGIILVCLRPKPGESVIRLSAGPCSAACHTCRRGTRPSGGTDQWLGEVQLKVADKPRGQAGGVICTLTAIHGS